MKKVIFDSSNGHKIDSLRIDGTTILGFSGVTSVEVDTSCGLWEVRFKDGMLIHSTGNVFICVKPTS